MISVTPKYHEEIFSIGSKSGYQPVCSFLFAGDICLFQFARADRVISGFTDCGQG